MIASDELFKLIKSLSQTEKRYFKVFASRHVIADGNNYVKLFDAIAAQKKYNEQHIKNQFKEQIFIKRYAAVKNYLHQLIIKSMRTYHSSFSIDMELKEMLIDINFLYQKGLYKQCKKIHAKAEKLSIETDNKIRHLELLEWKTKLFHVSSVETEVANFYKNIFLEETKLLDSIKRSLKIKNELQDVFSLIRKKGFARSKEDLSLMYEIIKKYNKLDYEDLTFSDKYYINYINTVYYTSAGNHAKSLNFTQRNIQLIEAISPKLREEEVEKYIVTLNNLVVNHLNLQQFNETTPYISKIRSLATHNIRENILLWTTSYKLVLGVSIKIGNFEEAERIVFEILSGINEFADKIPLIEIVTFKYNVATVYFINKKYSKSLEVLNEIINENNPSLRDDIQGFARILRLIVLWEKGEQEMLPYAAVSTYRFLYKRKRLYKFENIVLNFIKQKLPEINTSTKRLETFKELKVKLEALFKDSFERKVLDYFDFISWIESKITKKEFKQLVREKLKMEETKS